MAKEFDVSPSQVQWVAASCMIVWVSPGRDCPICRRISEIAGMSLGHCGETLRYIWTKERLLYWRCDMDPSWSNHDLHAGTCQEVTLSALLTDKQNLASINVCRALSGVGAAILLPASSGIVGALYPAGKKRTLAFVAISAGTLLAKAV